MTFQKATKKKSKLRLGLVGPSGSGKTFTALAIACAMAKRLKGRVAVIDTERGSASLYADKFDFDVLELESFHPEKYLEAMNAAADAGYVVIVLDSITHAWSGKDGVLEQKDNAAKRMKSGNDFTAWREATPLHNAFVDGILQSPAHIVATMRVKTEYVLEENEKGKKVPRKIGMAPIQRDGMEYEFTAVGDLDLDHNLAITKTRCDALDQAVIKKPGKKLADTLLDWLESGAAEAPRPAPAPAPAEEPATKPASAPSGLTDDQRAAVQLWTERFNGAPDSAGLLAAAKAMRAEHAKGSAVDRELVPVYAERQKALSANGKAA